MCGYDDVQLTEARECIDCVMKQRRIVAVVIRKQYCQSVFVQSAVLTLVWGRPTEPAAGASIQVIDPDGTRHNATESFLRRATNILDRYITCDEDGARTVKLLSRTLDQEITAFTAEPKTQRLTWNVRSPIDFDSFTISIHEREKDTEQLNVRMVEAWRHQFDRLIPRQPGDHDDPRKKVIGAATALIERLGRPPLDENYDNPGESAMFA